MALDRSPAHVNRLIASLEEDIRDEAIVYGSSRIKELIQQYRASVNELEAKEKKIVCHYCNKVFPASKITKDHIVPRSKGGANAAYNIVPACRPCNQDKGDKRPTCDCEKCREAIARWWKHPLDRKKNK